MGAMLIPLLGLAASAIGTGVQEWQNSQAGKLAENNYNKTRASLLSDMYANPLDSVANKALLSQMDRRLNKREEAIDNMAAAGGATFENTLAAKQASNEAMADVISGMLVGEQARQDQFRNQLLNLDSQRTAQQIAQKQQSGAMWAKLGDNIFNAAINLGGSMIESGTGVKDLFNFKP